MRAKAMVLTIAMFVATLSLPPLTAGAYQPLRRIPVSGTVGELHTDGRFVVWTAAPNGQAGAAQTLYAAALPDGQPVEVAQGLPPSDRDVKGDFAIDGGVVVWVEGKDMQRVIRTKNLVTGQTLTVATGEVTLPAIAGNTVTWWEHVGAQYAQRPAPQQEPAILKARNITTMEPPRTLAESENTIYRFGPSKMSSGWVVWTKATAGGYGGLLGWELSAVPLAGGATKTVGEAGYQTSSPFDLVDDRLVYLEPNGGGRPTFEFDEIQVLMVVVDLRTGEATETGPHGALTDLTTDGRYVFWGKWRDNFKLVDLWGYAPETESAFDILTGGATEGSNAGPPMPQPSARHGVLAWLWNVPGQGLVIETARLHDVLPTARRDAPGAGEQFFPETGHTLRGGFRAFWERSGGLPVFGYPLTEEFVEKNRDTGRGHPVQYLERQRYELHPENAGTPYEVLLGRLGVEMLRRQGRDWQAEPKANPAVPHYFAETGHAIAPQFWDYWRTHGLEFGDAGVSAREALALFGLPVTEPRMEQNSSGDTVLTQWFERARFEYHPNNPEAYRVLLGRLSADMLAQRGW